MVLNTKESLIVQNNAPGFASLVHIFINRKQPFSN